MSAFKQVTNENFLELLSQFNSLPEKETTHDGGNGGGHNGGMDSTRIIRLEEFADDAKQRLTRVETKLDNIEKEVSNFKWWVVAQIVAAIVTVVGTSIAIQQMTVSTFQAAGAQAQSPQQASTPNIIINVPPSTVPAAPQAAAPVVPVIPAPPTPTEKQ